MSTLVELPSASENAAVQEALSIRYVDKIGLAWLPDARQWGVFSNYGKLVSIVPALSEDELRGLCEGQNKEWRHQREAEVEARNAGPVVTTVSLGDLDL